MRSKRRDPAEGQQLKLMVVDDQGPVGEIISRIAQQGGWEAVHTVSSERVGEIVRAENIDVLLIDYAIDGNPRSARNGLNVVAELREEGIEIPAVMFSGWPDLINRRRASELKVMFILEKPLSIQELRNALDAAHAAVLAKREQASG